MGNKNIFKKMLDKLHSDSYKRAKKLVMNSPIREITKIGRYGNLYYDPKDLEKLEEKNCEK